MNEEQEYPNEWGQNQASQGPPPPPDYSQPQQPYQQQGYPPQQQQPYQQPNPQGYPPQGYGPPPKKSNTGLIVGIAVAVAAVAVVIILLMVFMNPFAPPIVGKWHITSMDTSGPYGNNHESVDYYIEFHSDGTGKSTSGSSSTSGNFHWKSVGSNQIEIQDDNSSYSITMTYHVNGNNLDLSFSYEGATVTYHGVRA